MPCYNGYREDERQDRETAKKVEAVLCRVISAFGFGRVLERLEFVGIGVTREWLVSWWREHLQKDLARKEADTARKEAVRKQAILDSGDYKRLGAMMNKPVDVMPTVLALQKAVPAGCETLAPPNPTVSGIRTTYYGDVRLVEAFDPIEGLMVSLADLYYREKQ